MSNTMAATEITMMNGIQNIDIYLSTSFTFGITGNILHHVRRLYIENDTAFVQLVYSELTNTTGLLSHCMKWKSS